MNWIKEKIISYVVSGLFESKYGKIIFGWANGHKVQIGRTISYLSLIILTTQNEFPDITWLNDVNSIFGLIAGFIVSELGIEHKVIKRKLEVIKLGE